MAQSQQLIANGQRQKKKEHSAECSHFLLFGGTYWTRTSDLCRVKAAL